MMKKLVFTFFLVITLSFPLAAQVRLGNFSQKGVATQEKKDSGLTASHSSLPLNTNVKVLNPANGKEIAVKINGRIGASSNRIIDLSAAAYNALDLKKGADIVEISIVLPPAVEPAPVIVSAPEPVVVTPVEVVQAPPPPPPPPEPEPEIQQVVIVEAPPPPAPVVIAAAPPPPAPVVAPPRVVAPSPAPQTVSVVYVVSPRTNYLMYLAWLTGMSMEERSAREARETREAREAREARESRESREAREVRESRESRLAREERESREFRDIMETRRIW